jgi:hypothetical protein
MADDSKNEVSKTPAQFFEENFPDAEISNLVESYWRAFLRSGNENPALSVEISQQFERKIREIAAGVGGEYEQIFLAAIERHRERLLEEYQADRAAFRRRLGVPLIQETPRPVANGNRASLGETVVRTAVRATVWESIRALFRAFK